MIGATKEGDSHGCYFGREPSRKCLLREEENFGDFSGGTSVGIRIWKRTTRVSSEIVISGFPVYGSYRSQSTLVRSLVGRSSSGETIPGLCRRLRILPTGREAPDSWNAQAAVDVEVLWALKPENLGIVHKSFT